MVRNDTQSCSFRSNDPSEQWPFEVMTLCSNDPSEQWPFGPTDRNQGTYCFTVVHYWTDVIRYVVYGHIWCGFLIKVVLLTLLDVVIVHCNIQVAIGASMFVHKTNCVTDFVNYCSPLKDKRIMDWILCPMEKTHTKQQQKQNKPNKFNTFGITMGIAFK